MNRMKGATFASFVLLAACTPACTRPAPDASCDGAVRLWLERMEASTSDGHAMREAYALLGPTARTNLEQRAERASRVQGRRVEPFEILAEGRFGLKFRPKTMTTKVTDDLATVEVLGGDPTLEHATVHCARDPRDPTAWRVEPELPEVHALPRRGSEGN